MTPAICVMMLLKLPGLRKLSALNEKKIAITTSPISTGQLPRLPPRMLSRARATKVSGVVTPGATAVGVGAHAASGWRSTGCPDTFVGTPAVIA